MAAVNDESMPINSKNFVKMAHGDIDGFKELAFDFFNETRRQLTGWQALIDSKNTIQLSDELHRCKGGASLFGLERMVTIIAASETPAAIESNGFDIALFERELSAAEAAVTEFVG